MSSIFKTVFVAVILNIFLGCFSNRSLDNCFNVKDYYWKHLASKTPYRYVANLNDSSIQYDGCVPQKIWAVIRHGTRYPKAKFINKINERLIEIRNMIRENSSQNERTLCEAHLNNITNWKLQVDLADEKKLAHEGENEMVELAERFLNRFPSLLDVEYSNSTFSFRSTATKRTIKSKYYFTVGLFGRRIAHHVWSPEPIYKDPVLRFYKACPKWINEVEKNPTTYVELEKFLDSEEIQKLIESITVRLGLKEVSVDDLLLMYLTCTYESSWNRASFSPWCSVFSERDMEVMEFVRDLKYYWASGYGNDLNFKPACMMLKDFYQHSQSDDNVATFYFTHSGTILKFLAHLGLYYDEFKLTHEKFQRPRLWKTSYMDTFGGNLAFIIYQCGDEKKLLTLHQERPVKLPGCPKDGLCRLDKIFKVFKNSFTNCDLSEICSV